MDRIPIPGFDGYSITEGGVVFSRHGRPLAPHVDRDGYLRISLAIGHGKDSRRLHRGIHQLIAMTFIGPCPEGQEVRHLDGDKSHNHRRNIGYADHLTNIRDKHLHGTMPRGESHPMAKLTLVQVREIKIYLAMQFTQREVGEIFNISQSMIHLINAGKNWRESYA